MTPPSRSRERYVWPTYASKHVVVPASTSSQRVTTKLVEGSVNMCACIDTCVAYNRFFRQSNDWKHLYLCFLYYDVSCISARTAASRSNFKVHRPAIDSLVLPLQCSKATAVFVSSRHRDFVAEAGKCGPRSIDLFFLVVWPSFFLTAPSMSSIRTYEYFPKNLVRCDVFLRSIALKHTVSFKSIFLRFLGTSQADCGVGDTSP